MKGELTRRFIPSTSSIFEVSCWAEERGVACASLIFASKSPLEQIDVGICSLQLARLKAAASLGTPKEFETRQDLHTFLLGADPTW